MFREGLAGIVAKIRAAGIRVCMMTGDHALTATTLSLQIGLLTQTKFDTLETFQSADEKKWTTPTTKALLLTGDDIDDLDEADWHAINKYDELVFARLKPEQKVPTNPVYINFDRRRTPLIMYHISC